MSPERLTPQEEPSLISGHTVEEWHQSLCTYNGESSGHLATPGSRYGGDADSCAWYAIALLAIYEQSGIEPEEAEATLDWCMSLAVNDHEDVGEMIREYQYMIPEEVKEHLDLEGED